MIAVRPYRIALLIAALASTLEIAAAQTINLLTEDAFPFQYLEDKKLTGMAVEVVNEAFKRAGIAHKDEILSWKDAYDRTQIYPNTCVYSTARTENREVVFKWIGPIVENKWAAFAKKGFKGTLSRPEDLAQYRVGVLQGDAKERYLKDLRITFRVPEADDARNPSKLTLNRMEPDKIDLWITGYYSGAHIAAKTGVKDVVPVWVFQSSENYLACNLSLPEATVGKLQKALDAMKRDGSHKAILSRYEAKIKAQ
ncbi:MAG: transporter substrate-binding domain-containing protein [Sulfuritalea sp.]|nr:transporter substrate-binding domain-containing protein [Sulfuritalea sp.]